jgi:hypothetical protein
MFLKALIVGTGELRGDLGRNRPNQMLEDLFGAGWWSNQSWTLEKHPRNTFCPQSARNATKTRVSSKIHLIVKFLSGTSQTDPTSVDVLLGMKTAWVVLVVIVAVSRKYLLRFELFNQFRWPNDSYNLIPFWTNRCNIDDFWVTRGRWTGSKRTKNPFWDKRWKLAISFVRL